VKIARDALDAIHRHGAQGYPNEICGIMLGPRGQGRVTEVRPVRNVITDRAHDRYELDPLEHIRVQRDADAARLDIVGYYHSHPDHPAQPSVFDAERCWAGYVYLIVAIEGGRPAAENAFVAQKDGGPFRSEPLQVG
jgi:proteasome lid subunit RPN8/RPN11